MEIINYDDLVKEYNENISNILRGFRPKFDFLEMWVPDSDPLEGIVNLVETAFVSGENSIFLSVSKETFNSIDKKELISECKTYGQVEIEEKDSNVILNVSNGKGNSEKKAERSLEKQYHTKAVNYANVITHEVVPQESEGQTMIRGQKDGMILFLCIDSKSGIIKESAFTGVNNELERGVFECFCTLVDGIPVQEAVEHGVINCEYHLREDKTNWGVKGIRNYFNMDDIFKILLDLVRDAYSYYSNHETSSKKINFYFRPMTSVWRKKNSEEKVQEVKNFIESSKIKNLSDLKVLDIEQSNRIMVEFNSEKSSKEKGHLLLSLESELREKVDPTLQVYMVPKKDKNSIRRL